jgi:3alpha(or 20beta)-hydroxysteroid dehydrogenase
MGPSERSGRVEGKVVLVTGAARGTGEQTARLLVAEGARVVASDVRGDLAKKVVGELGENAVFYRTRP